MNYNHLLPFEPFLADLEKKYPNRIPSFDPLDGGVNARVLFVLETPGPKVMKTGLIARSNPDQTARNMSEFLENAKIERSDTLLWNVVPWIICIDGKNRNPNNNEIIEGGQYLTRLIKKLNNLRALVLVGKKAQRAKEKSAIFIPNHIKIFTTPHPSPQHVNRHKLNRQKLQNAFYEIATYLYKT